MRKWMCERRYYRRTKAIIRSELKRKKKFTAIETLAVPTLS